MKCYDITAFFYSGILNLLSASGIFSSMVTVSSITQGSFAGAEPEPSLRTAIHMFR